MAEHHGAGEQRCARVGHTLAGNVLGHMPRALLEDGHRLPHIHPRKQSWPARQSRHLSTPSFSNLEKIDCLI